MTADDRWPTIRYAPVGDLTLAYETFGNPADPTILLVMGLGAQMLGWPDELCESLAASGHHVIRFYNRDIGLSTHLDHLPAPSTPDLLLRRSTPYRLTDMANDTFGLLDHLGIEQVHLVGTSMGGFISQTMALRSPERIRTLSLSMTSTGSRRVGQPTAAVLRRLARQNPPASRQAAMDDTAATYRIIGSPGHGDEDKMRELAGISWDRSSNPNGRLRQLAAIMAQSDRTAALRTLRIPTVVVHGLSDPLVAASGGLALAKAISGATFVGYHGMGHDLPHSRWGDLSASIVGLIDRA